MSRHSFDPKIAGKVGLNAAVVLSRIRFLGEQWLIGDMALLEADLFYLRRSKIERCITKLVDHGYLDPEAVTSLSLSRTRHPCAWVKARVRERDGGACVYCGSTAGRLEVDHIVAWSRGGSNAMENLALACRSCNAAKRDLSVTDFLKMRAEQ